MPIKFRHKVEIIEIILLLLKDEDDSGEYFINMIHNVWNKKISHINVVNK